MAETLAHLEYLAGSRQLERDGAIYRQL
jgi:hypothetical protein